MLLLGHCSLCCLWLLRGRSLALQRHVISCHLCWRKAIRIWYILPRTSKISDIPLSLDHWPRVESGVNKQYSHKNVSTLDFQWPIGGAMRRARSQRVLQEFEEQLAANLFGPAGGTAS